MSNTASQSSERKASILQKLPSQRRKRRRLRREEKGRQNGASAHHHDLSSADPAVRGLTRRQGVTSNKADEDAPCNVSSETKDPNEAEKLKWNVDPAKQSGLEEEEDDRIRMDAPGPASEEEGGIQRAANQFIEDEPEAQNRIDTVGHCNGKMCMSHVEVLRLQRELEDTKAQLLETSGKLHAAGRETAEITEKYSNLKRQYFRWYTTIKNHWVPQRRADPTHKEDMPVITGMDPGTCDGQASASMSALYEPTDAPNDLSKSSSWRCSATSLPEPVSRATPADTTVIQSPWVPPADGKHTITTAGSEILTLESKRLENLENGGSFRKRASATTEVLPANRRVTLSPNPTSSTRAIDNAPNSLHSQPRREAVQHDIELKTEYSQDTIANMETKLDSQATADVGRKTTAMSVPSSKASVGTPSESAFLKRSLSLANDSSQALLSSEDLSALVSTRTIRPRATDDLLNDHDIMPAPAPRPAVALRKRRTAGSSSLTEPLPSFDKESDPALGDASNRSMTKREESTKLSCLPYRAWTSTSVAREFLRREGKSSNQGQANYENKRSSDSHGPAIWATRAARDNAKRPSGSTSSPSKTVCSSGPPLASSPSSDDENHEPTYKYHEVVRGREARQALLGYTCPECEELWKAVSHNNDHFNRMDFLACSKHRARFIPQSTPDDFWNLSFPDE